MMRWLVCLGFALLTGPAMALDAGTALTQYAHARWDHAQGLPHSSVNAIAQTADDYLWIGTEEGLARFDGDHFVLFNKRNTPAFHKNHVQALCAAPDGTLWIATLDGAVRFDGERFTHVSIAGDERQRKLNTLYCAPDGKVYGGASSGKLYMLDASGAYPMPGWTPQSGEIVTALAQAPDGGLLVGTFGAGVQVCEQGTCTPWLGANDLPSAWVTALSVDVTGAIWIGMHFGGLLRVDAGPTSRPELFKGVPQGAIWAIVADSDGNHWLSIQGAGLVRVNDAGVQTLTKTFEQVSIVPDVLLEDHEKNLWVGSVGTGLHRFSDVRAKSFGAREGLSDETVWSVLEDSKGTLWAGTNGGGAARIGTGAGKPWTFQNDLRANIVGALAQTADGHMWFGTHAGLYVSRDGATPVRDQRPGAPHAYLTALFVDSRGRLWAGSIGQALAVQENGQWRSMGDAQGFDGRSTRALAEDREGGIWAATISGAHRYFDAQWTHFGVAQGLSLDRTLGVFVDSSDGVWVLVDEGGLHRIVGDHAVALGAAAGLPTDLLLSMIEDDLGFFWFGTNSGAYRVAKADLDAVVAGRLAKADATQFDTSDGMRSSECSGIAQPLVWKAHDGALWFATSSGVSRIDPARLSINQRAPRVVIESVRADGVEVDHVQGGLLPVGTKHIEVSFAALSFTAPERVRFRYKLEGVDQRWVQGQGRRQVEFVGMRPGNYRFFLSASINGGDWSSNMAQYAFSIAAPFTETPEFYMLVLVALAVLGVGLHRYRLTALRARTAALMERTRIARELHDTLAQSFSGILVRLQVALRLVPPESESLRVHLDNAQSLARDSFNEVRQAIAELRPETRVALRLPETLQHQVMRHLDGTGIALIFRQTGMDLVVDPLTLHHVCRIVQEAVSNAMLHSDTREIVLEVDCGPELTKVSVIDHGSTALALRPTARVGGAGLAGMQARANEIDAQLDVVAVDGGGTCVQVTILSGEAAQP